MKKLVASVFAAMLVASFTFAQEVNVSFENKISSDVISISKDESVFAGIKEQVTAEIETEKVDAGVSFITYLNKTEDGTIGFTEYEFDKAYMEFRPVEFLSVDFRRKIFTPGSYLPIIDDNVGNGDIGSDFALVVKPIENLAIGGGLNIPSLFGDGENKADCNFGINYETELFSVGASIRSPINDLKFGVFGSFTGIENLTASLGFSYNDEFADVKGTLLTAAAIFEQSILTLQFDFVTKFGGEGQDLYTALCLETSVAENWIVEAQATLTMDYEDAKETHVIPEVGAAYVNGNHKVRAGVAVDISDNNIGVTFPVYYKYSF